MDERNDVDDDVDDNVAGGDDDDDEGDDDEDDVDDIRSFRQKMAVNQISRFFFPQKKCCVKIFDT